MTKSKRTSPKLRVSRLAVAAPLALLLLGACGSPKTDAPQSESSPAETAATSAGENEIAMHLIAFSPDTLEVAKGTSVTWSQQDAGFHTATSGTAAVDASGTIKTDPDGKFDSGKLAMGKTFSFTFSDAGTYRYFCEVHPATMRGQVKVS